MQFHLRVISILLETSLKDHVDSSSRLLEKKALVSGFVNILVFFINLVDKPGWIKELAVCVLL